jgi:ferrochelatase
VSQGHYDAVLLVSFGGPEGPADVLPFLENVTRARAVPRERLLQVAEHYYARGGVSPINAHNRDLLAALREDFAAHGLDLPVYWGNRNWQPSLPDTLATMADDGIRRALAVVTSAYSSYSGCRQYREDLAAARAAVGPRAPSIDKVRPFFDHPAYAECFVDSAVAALAGLGEGARDDARLLFSTHSLPLSMAEASGPSGGAYVAQHRAVADTVARRIAERTGRRYEWDLVFQSRSGSPAQPWLEPDVSDQIRVLADKGVPGVVVVPIGFVSDHMEVVHDLDTEAAAAAADVGLPFVRAATPGRHPAFVAMLRDLVRERVEGTTLDWACCQPHCCPNPRAALPVVAQC